MNHTIVWRAALGAWLLLLGTSTAAAAEPGPPEFIEFGDAAADMNLEWLHPLQFLDGFPVDLPWPTSVAGPCSIERQGAGVTGDRLRFSYDLQGRMTGFVREGRTPDRGWQRVPGSSQLVYGRDGRRWVLRVGGGHRVFNHVRVASRADNAGRWIRSRIRRYSWDWAYGEDGLVSRVSAASPFSRDTAVQWRDPTTGVTTLVAEEREADGTLRSRSVAQRAGAPWSPGSWALREQGIAGPDVLEGLLRQRPPESIRFYEPGASDRIIRRWTLTRSAFGFADADDGYRRLGLVHLDPAVAPPAVGLVGEPLEPAGEWYAVFAERRDLTLDVRGDPLELRDWSQMPHVVPIPGAQILPAAAAFDQVRANWATSAERPEPGKDPVTFRYDYSCWSAAGPPP